MRIGKKILLFGLVLLLMSGFNSVLCYAGMEMVAENEAAGEVSEDVGEGIIDENDVNNEGNVGSEDDIIGNENDIGDTNLGQDDDLGLQMGEEEGEPEHKVDDYVDLGYRDNNSQINQMTNLSIDLLSFDEVIYGDIMIMENTTISNRSVCYAGDVYVNANFSINNSNVTVLGELVCASNYTVINNSSLTVQGDMRIQSKNADGIYGATDATFSMRNNSELTVYGDFYTQSTKVQPSSYYSPGYYESYFSYGYGVVVEYKPYQI